VSGETFAINKPVIQRRFRQQHREDDGAHIMRHAPDDVGEQELRDQHRDDAAEPHARLVSPKIAVRTGSASDAGDDRERKARSPSTRSQ